MLVRFQQRGTNVLQQPAKSFFTAHLDCDWHGVIPARVARGIDS